MKRPLLVRHPACHPTESFPGYILRLIEANGYWSPPTFYSAIGLKRDETSLTNFNHSALAEATNQPLASLEHIAWACTRPNTTELLMLGKRIGSAEVSVNSARLCRQCVEEKGFIEACWHLELMVACPIHRRTAVWFCSRCKTKLTWIRQGIQICRCGAGLQEPDVKLYTSDEMQLLSLVRRKALDLEGWMETDSLYGPPDWRLQELGLQELLSLIRLLGKTQKKERLYPRDLLRHAASTLKDWPVNFRKLLDSIWPTSPSTTFEAAAETRIDWSAIAALIRERHDARSGKNTVWTSA